MLVLLLLAPSARAEDPIVATPLPPLGVPEAPPVQTPPPAPVWLPKGGAILQVLDKVNARATVMTVKVGETATFGSLSIAVKACVIRPPDAPADAAAFLTVTDKNPDAPGFTGWMLKSAPSVSMLAHPIYDLRVTGCSG